MYVYIYPLMSTQTRQLYPLKILKMILKGQNTPAEVHSGGQKRKREAALAKV